MTFSATGEHDHKFAIASDPKGERNVLRATVLTFVMMLIEIGVGFYTHSMALLADGWHMATHAGALGIAVYAYRFARRHAANPDFTFGTGKVSALAGFGNAAALALVSILLAVESIPRFWQPETIRFDEAIDIAILGLVVNLATAFLLRHDHSHHGHAHGGEKHDHSAHDHHAHDDHDHGHDHDHAHHDHDHHAPAKKATPDHNMRAAYLHIVSDALVSVLAIVALSAGKYLGWAWLDPAMGIVGGVVIARWSIDLMRDSGCMLLDQCPTDLERRVRARIEETSAKVTDLHLWTIGSGQYVGIVSLVSPEPMAPIQYKELLAEFESIVHVTVEVNTTPISVIV